MADDESEYLKLPVEDRCVHKIWKARVSGYEEAVKLFGKWDGDDNNWKKFHGLIKKFITDTNAVAQEKGLETALVYVENCDVAGKVVGECVEGIVSKCVAAPKTKTKDMAKQIALMFVEIEQPDKAIEELLKGLSHKNPKVASGCINIITASLHAFGAKVIKVSPLLKGVVPLLDHRDKVVREEGKQLIVEAYRWVGAVMKQQLSAIKPVQLAELETEFANMDGAKARPERLLRSQQQFGAVAETDTGNAEKGVAPEEEEPDEETDPYDLLDPVDILEKLPKNFYELVEEKKWQLRKEALDALLSLSQTPKIQPGEFGDLVRVLKKFISKDTNVMLVTQAAQCITGIAKGLRQQFKNGSNQLLPAILEKFKEKKVNVVAALAEAADAIYSCIGIEGIQEDCLATLQHKTPNVVIQTAIFLARCFAKCPAAIITNKKMSKGYILALGERLTHSDLGVRESTSEAIGVCFKIIGEQAITKLMPDLEPIKLTRIKEFAEKAEITGKMPKQISQAEGENSKTKAKVVKPTKAGPKVVKPGAARNVPKPTSQNIDSPDDDDDIPNADYKSRPATTKPTPKKASTTKRPVMSAKASIGSRKKEEIDSSAPYVANNLKSQRFKEETRLKVLKWNFTTPRQDVIDQLKEQMIAASFSANLILQLYHNDFKQHLKAIDTMTKYIQEDTESLISNLDLLLKWTTLRFFETNPQSLLRSLDYINKIFTVLAEQSYNLHEIEAVSFIPYLITKVGDPKDQVRNSIRQIFKLMCQVFPVSKFSPYLMDGLKQKNAKLRAECLDEIGEMLKNYGMNILQPTPAACLKEIAKSIADRDRSVRDGALNAITEAYFQVGEKMYKMVGNLKEKDMAMLEERIKRVSKTRPIPGEQPAPAVQPQSNQPQNNLQGNEVGSREMQSNTGPKSSLPTATGRKLNFRQFLPPGAVPPVPSNSDGTRRSPSAGTTGIPNPSQRPQTKLDRPVSGAFTLDLDKIEGERAGYIDSRASGPQLVNHNLDEIFNDDPIKLPMYRRPNSGVTQYGQDNLLSPMSSRTAPGRSLEESQEAKDALDVVFAQLFNTQDTSACLNALTQLDEVIKDNEKVVLLGDRMDQLLIACWTQYRHVLNQKMAADDYNIKDVTRLLQFVTMVLMSMYHHQELTKKASMSTLHDLLHVIISILLEPKVQLLPEPDGGQLIRALNVLTVKILDRSDSTNVTSAFIKLLRDCVGNTSLSPKFVELVMKCLWKVIRQLPKWMESNKLNIDLLLADLHEFLKAYPSSYWKQQVSDTPMRTVKTVLHTMAKAKGDAILDHLTRINDPANSELVPYLKKLLNSGVGGKENQATHNQDDTSNVIIKNGNNKANAPGEILMQQKPRFTKSDHEALAEIFKKIGQKEQTKVGLQELYQFKQQNPQADLEPFLSKSSPYFRNYIERGLKSIEDENASSYGNRFASQNILADATKDRVNTWMGNGSQNDAQTGSSGQELHNNYLDKLNMLRKQAGLEAYLDKNGSTSSATSGIGTGSAGSDIYKISSVSNSARSANDADRYSDNSSSTVTMKSNYEKNSIDNDYSSNDGNSNTDVEDIRKRLERIKHSAFQ